MADYQILNNKVHQTVKVDTPLASQTNSNVDAIVIFPTEFGEIQKEYPIVFRKNPQTGEFACFCLFGLEQGENLFFNSDNWKAHYLPAAIARGPFLVGYQNQIRDNQTVKEPVISIDMNHPSVNDQQGEELFAQDGSPSQYLQMIQKRLLAIHHGKQFEQDMFQQMLAFDLIEPFAIEVQLNNGRQFKLEENYTIHQEKLFSLTGEQLEVLNKKGFLQAAYAVLGSMSNVGRLVEMKNNQG
ncbi:MAG: SapC family protein [Kangiellaceae bacterium]|nr:SapC family protein [Kangiellaceae bacterium]MCW9016155.1 SapC family protein [Kangiellaceae bacterium]